MRLRAGPHATRPLFLRCNVRITAAVASLPSSPSAALARLADPAFTRRLFFVLLAATGALKLLAASLVPMTGDEAYFILWGRHPDYGYYDHGPMVGWWLSALLQVSDAPGWLRLPAVVIPLAVAVWLRRALRPCGDAKADLAASMFLLSPLNLANFLIATDTPLFAFAVAAGIVALEADRRGRAGLWLAAGFLLGLAFLAKYLAVVMGIAWMAWQLLRPAPRGWRPIGWVLLGALPPVAVNVLWNHHHGWTNLLFNVLTRNDDAGIKPASPFVYLLLWSVLLGPTLVPLLVAGLRRHGLRDGWRQLHAAAGAGPVMMAAVPALVFGAVSLVQEVGLHWLMAYVPWAVFALAAAAPAEKLQAWFKPAAFYAGLQVVLMIIAMAAPSSWLAGTRQHTSVVLGVHTAEVLAALEPYRADYVLASDSYARAALLAYHGRREVPVVGFGSHHGRQDDLLTDFRTLDGGNLMFFSHRPGRVEQARPWFESVEVRQFEIRGATFTLLLGRGFKYDVYRETVLREIGRRYYTAPAWLLRLSPPGDFIQRYELPALAR